MHTFEEINQIQVTSEAKEFQTFKGIEYVMLDLSAHFGWDKENFETRLSRISACPMEWWEEHLHLADEPVLAQKAINAYRDALAGVPTGYVMGFDAVCSGVQILSCVTGCMNGARETGLVTPNVRKDAYGAATGYMNDVLAEENKQVDVERSEMKDALMPYFYGSKAEPKKLFGKDTLELEVFYKVCHSMFEGASAARDLALSIWQPYQERHTWTLPDGHTASPPNIEKVNMRFRIAELGGSQFTHVINKVMGAKQGVSLAGNITHAIDGYVVREMNRRCNYSLDELIIAKESIEYELCDRNVDIYEEKVNVSSCLATNEVLIISKKPKNISTEVLVRSLHRIVTVLEHRPFEIITVHDCFFAAPNNMNRVRYWYKEILAELADSNILEDIVKQITGDQNLQLGKLSNDLSNYIRKSNYALC